MLRWLIYGGIGLFKVVRNNFFVNEYYDYEELYCVCKIKS